jgi:hypothetical protein
MTNELTSRLLEGPWCRLAAWHTQKEQRVGRVEDVRERQSLLIERGAFDAIFERLDAVGNTLSGLSEPGGGTWYEGREQRYRYTPFHEFEIRGTGHVGEPLVCHVLKASGTRFVINPDLLLHLGVEERPAGTGVWWDPRRGVEAIVTKEVDNGRLSVVDIQSSYLKEYLQARQMVLLVGNYRHLLLFNPSEAEVSAFGETGDIVLGASEKGVKAELNNWGLRDDFTFREPFLQRRLHMWSIAEPPAIDIDDPWAEKPDFDVFGFTFPTDDGPVAPGQWAHFAGKDEGEFAGVDADFMTHVYFRQEVLVKYQGSAGFSIDADGSLHCGYFWGLYRSTRRIGNDLIATMIGDFAEGVPLEEWLHWKQYAVEPPSIETAKALCEEAPIPEAIRGLHDALSELNDAFARFAYSLGVRADDTVVWEGSLESLAGKQLQWVYPSSADDSEFLTRATLLSTFVIEGLGAPLLRKTLKAIPGGLHMTNDNPPKPLGSRNLLQRSTLIAMLLIDLEVDVRTLGELVGKAENPTPGLAPADLIDEIVRLRDEARRLFAPLAFLYDLRISGGLAHAPNPRRVAEAALQLGLPESGWHRTHYLQLVEQVTGGVWAVAEKLQEASYVVHEQWLDQLRKAAGPGKPSTGPGVST